MQSLVLLTAPASPCALSAGGAFTQWTVDLDGSDGWTPAGLLEFRTPLCGRSEGVLAASPDEIGAYLAPDAAAERPASVLFRGHIGCGSSGVDYRDDHAIVTVLALLERGGRPATSAAEGSSGRSGPLRIAKVRFVAGARELVTTIDRGVVLGGAEALALGGGGGLEEAVGRGHALLR